MTEPPQIPKTPEMIEALLKPDAYPKGVKTAGGIELIQTHISYVLLTDDFAYKIKKPVNFGFLDFSTLESRRHFCKEEIRLNRRLAPSLYLGVVTVTKQKGLYYIDAPKGHSGAAVTEYAVKMRRIPAGSTLEELIENESATPEIIKRVGARIAHFHDPRLRKGNGDEAGAGAATDERISGFGTPEKIKISTDENFAQTEDFAGETISKKTFDLIKEYTNNFLTEEKELLESRVTGGFIRDCHGDIHAEHVVLTGEEGVEIFDCIEFSERFRFTDIVAEIAFLSMDLDFRGRADLAKIVEESYFSATGDFTGRRLLNFYKCYRAYIRGKVESFKYRAPEVDEEQRAAALFNARHHFFLAKRYAAGCADDCVQPMLIVVRGMSGTGKSRLAAKIARLLGATVISSDRVRKELAGIDASKHRYEKPNRGIYSPGFTEKTYEEMHRRAAKTLCSGRSCVLDATYAKTAHLDAAASVAAHLFGEAEATGRGYGLSIIETTAPAETVLDRIKRRGEAAAQKGDAVSDATREIYAMQQKSFETPGVKRLVVDTTGSECETMNAVATEIFG